MLEGVLIAESLRTGTSIDDLRLTVRKLSRWPIPETGPGQPPVWTILEFVADGVQADDFARRLSEVLDDAGWYVDFNAGVDKYVVFPGKVLRYRRGDSGGRGEATAYARSLGIPESQLDWAE